MGSGFLQEVKADFNEINHINEELDPPQILLVGQHTLAVTFSITGLVNIREHHDEGCHEEVVDS